MRRLLTTVVPLIAAAPAQAQDWERWHMPPMWGIWNLWGFAMMAMMLVFWGVVSARGEIDREEFDAKKRDLA